MTTNLTSSFQSALLEKDRWTHDSVRRVLTALSRKISSSYPDWEEGGENWARLIYEGNVVAIVNAIVPVFAVLPMLNEEAERVAASEGCERILANSFSDELFSVDKGLLERIVDRTLSGNVDYDNLSIDDLWWATI